MSMSTEVHVAPSRTHRVEAGSPPQDLPAEERLATLPGVGPQLARRLMDAMGGAERVIGALERGEVGELASVEGLSARRALQLARHVRGAGAEVAATEPARRIHERLLAALASHAGGPASRDAVRLLAPWSRSEREALEARRDEIGAALALATEAPEALASWRAALRGLEHPKQVQGRWSKRVIVTADEAVHAQLLPLQRHCRVLLMSKEETARDYEVFERVTWIGRGAPDSPPGGWLVLRGPETPEAMIPELALAWAEQHERLIATLVAATELPPLPGQLGTRSNAALQGLDTLAEVRDTIAAAGSADELRRLADELWGEAKAVQAEAEASLHASVADARLELGGGELLELLGDETSLRRRLEGEVQNAVETAREAGRERLAAFLEPARIDVLEDPFERGISTKLKRTWLDDMASTLTSAAERADSLRQRDLAAAIAPLVTPVRRAVAALVELDVLFAVAAWADHERMILPELADAGLGLRGGRHLLLGFEADAVDYGVGAAADEDDRQPVALLSGANSGGKTTLLELLAQVQLLTQMGLPVPATTARVGLVDELHVLGKASGTQSAGALEQTLLQLAEVVTSPRPKLVLADELEAITEPGAAARIMAGLLEAALEAPATNVVLVTHVADAIREAAGVELRIDGIEARGLDEELELIVDRTPRRDHLARSTPELIVRRLVERGSEAASRVFSTVLARFDD